MRPSRQATSSARGTLAAEVLAWRSSVTMKFAADEIQNADVGLVRHHPVDGRNGDAGVIADFARRPGQGIDGQLEDRLAVHAQEWVTRHLAPNHVAGRAQDVVLGAVRIQPRGQNARLFRGAEHHCAGTVAEQHAGAAIAPVQNAGEDLGADHKGVVRPAGPDESVGGGERVDETAAHGLDIKGRGAARPQIRLHQAGRAGENEVRRGSRDDDQVDGVGRHAGVFQRGARGAGRQVAGFGSRLGDVPLADAGAFHDPGVRRLDTARRQIRSQIIVADDTLGQKAARSCDPGVWHIVSGKK
jgi:hypothetical protein